MSDIKQIMKNTVTGWLSVFILSVISIVLVPFLIKHMGKEGYGLIGLLGMIIFSLSNVTDLGIRGALRRDLTEHVTRGDRRAFNELIITAFVFFTALAFFLVLLIWVLAPWLVKVFKVSTIYQPDFIRLIRIYGSISMVISLISPVYGAGITSYNRYDAINVITILSKIFSALMLFAVIPLSNNPLYGWAGVMLGYKVFILFLQVSCFRRFCGAIVYRSDMLNPRRLFVLFRLGISLQLINFSQALADQANVYILSFFRGPEGVALYNPVDKVAIMFRSVVMTFANQLVTFATKAHTKGDKDKLSKLLLSGTKYTLLPGVLFGTGMFIFAEPFSRLWLSGVLAGEYLIVARVMRAYAVTELILYLSGTQWPLLLAHRTVKFPTFMYIITAVVNILFSIYFVGFTAAGIAGVLYGTIIGKGIRVPVLIFYSLRLLNIKGKDYIRETLSGPLCCFLFTAMAGWLLIIFFSCDSWIRLFSMAVVMALVWGMACWIVGFNGEDRLRVISLIKKNFKH